MAYNSKFAGAQIDALLDASEAMQTSKEDVANKVTSLDADATDVQYPSAKAVKDALQAEINRAKIAEQSKVDKYNVWNLIDNAKLQNAYITSDGRAVGNTQFICSDYSAVPAGAKYIIFRGHAYGTAVNYIAAYDSELNLLKSQKVDGNNIQMFDISDVDGVSYIRYSVHKNSIYLRAEVATDASQTQFQYPNVYNPISGWTNDLYDRMSTVEEGVAAISGLATTDALQAEINRATIAEQTNAQAIATKENLTNKVMSINADVDDDHYPSAKAVKDAIDSEATRAQKAELLLSQSKVDKYNVWNLIDNAKLQNAYITSDGRAVGNTQFICSDYSAVPAGAKYIIFRGHAYGTAVNYIAAYDSELNLLKSQKVDGNNIQMFDISDVDGVSYIRYSVHKNSIYLRAEVATDASQTQFQYPNVYNPISGWTNDFCDRMSAVEADVSEIGEKVLLKKTIICVGDSLTANGSELAYPAKLQALVGDKYDVRNYGIGGDTTVDICARIGAIAAETSVDFTIPKEKDTEFTLPTVSDELGNITNYGIVSSMTGYKINIYTKGGYLNSSTITPITINGIELAVQNSTISGPVVVKTKEEMGADVEIKAGSTVVMNGYKLCQDADIIIVNMGANGGYNTDISSEYSIVKQFECIAKKYKCKLLFITPHTVNMYSSFREAMRKAYGVNYLDTRLYFSTKAIYDALTLGLVDAVTDQDIADMQAGNCPTTLLADGIHFNDIGRTLLTNLIFKTLKTLGYVNE